jgi:hypothetical protein
MSARRTEPKQVIEDQGILRKLDDFTLRFKPWRSETPSTNFQVYPLDVEKDAIARLERDIRIGEGYRPRLISFIIIGKIQNSQLLEAGHSETSFASNMVDVE